MKRLLLPLLLFAQVASAQVTEQIPTAKEVGAKVCPTDIAPIGTTFEGMPQLQRPAFPERTLNIRKTKGNIQRAIDQLAKRGGGHVIVPAGDWKSGRITLRDKDASRCATISTCTSKQVPASTSPTRSRTISQPSSHATRVWNSIPSVP